MLRPGGFRLPLGAAPEGGAVAVQQQSKPGISAPVKGEVPLPVQEVEYRQQPLAVPLPQEGEQAVLPPPELGEEPLPLVPPQSGGGEVYVVQRPVEGLEPSVEGVVQ